MSILNNLYCRFPRLEVASRSVYCRVKNIDIINRSKLMKKMKSYLSGRESGRTDEKSWKKYSAYIRGLGITNGDILIVHSSMDGLKKMGIDKKEAVEFLQEIIGSEGTLVMPAYPSFKKKGIKVAFDEETEEVRKYNPKTTLAWTGILPNYLCTLEGARRSLFPIDTLVAIGKEADTMMEGNLTGEISHGKHTAWDYCNNRHAKVLFFGINPSNCISEMHLFEDLNEAEWPIKGWYKEQKFIIKNGEKQLEFTCKKRKIFWDQYLTINHAIMCLIKGGILNFDNIEGMPIGFIRDLSAMTDFVADNVKGKKDLLFWKIPRKYWK